MSTTGPRRGITTFTERGIESLKAFLADVRTWEGGVRQFLEDNQGNPRSIARTMDAEQKS
jgi:hypothetical protein